MKNFLFILSFLFCAVVSFSQSLPTISGFPNNQSISNGATLYHAKGGLIGDSGIVVISFPDTATANYGTFIKNTNGIIIKVVDTLFMRDAVIGRWIKFGGTSSASGGLVGGPITSNRFTIGTNPGVGLTTDQWIDSVFYYAQPPTATLTGGGIFEFTSAPTFNTTLNWGASRQSATTPIVSIVVAGQTQTFAQPTAPGTVSGTQAVTVTTNTGTTYNNVVTATDGQSATASTTFTYRSKYYIGFVATSTPTDADIIAATGGTVGGTFATAFATTGSLPAPGAESYIVIAYPSSFGSALVKINGLLVNYVLTTRAFVNASGYSVSYNIYVSPFATNAGVDYQVL